MATERQTHPALRTECRSELAVKTLDSLEPDNDGCVTFKRSEEQLRAEGVEYAGYLKLADRLDRNAFELGAVLSEDEIRFKEPLEGLREEDRLCLEKERQHKWFGQKPLMFCVIVICSVCAAIQGMDETVVNGAQIEYAKLFGISGNVKLMGLCNGTPYLACFLLGCWLTVPLNHWLGRRGVIFSCSCLSVVACLWQAMVNSWWHLVIARFVLGLSIGPMSATVPVYAAETAPAIIRGALCMQWQMWTAFGIMLGLAVGLAFYHVPDPTSVPIHGLSWRLMMASPMALALIVAGCVAFVPESPRWLLEKRRPTKAYHAMCRLRCCKVQAARDIFQMKEGLLQEEKLKMTATSNSSWSKIASLITVPRNRRALYASELVMFMQQFCGINVIAYYSSEIFLSAGFSHTSALAASLGFGAINWVFSLPAMFTIDLLGRRKLLLLTFPVMGVLLIGTGLSFLVPEAWADGKYRIGFVATGIYTYTAVYSVGPGPVPFTYSAEAYPLQVRTYGMALATATTWGFNFALSMSWPSIEKAFTPTGGFAFYGTWNLIGMFATWWLVRETKGYTLEQLDGVFGDEGTARFVSQAVARLTRRLSKKGCNQPGSGRDMELR